MWEVGRKELNLTVPNSFGIRIISLQSSITVELHSLASYVDNYSFFQFKDWKFIGNSRVSYDKGFFVYPIWWKKFH